MLHIINSLYFALVTTFTVQSCTMGEWYESIIFVMISIEVLSHCDYQYKGEKQKYLLPQSSEDNELLLKALFAQF